MADAGAVPTATTTDPTLAGGSAGRGAGGGAVGGGGGSRTRKLHSDSSSSDSDDGPESHQFKVIVLGDGAVGKTSVIYRFTQDLFSHTYKQTIGVDFFSRRIVLPGDVNVTMQVWDIGGQSIGSKMIENYIAGSHAILLAYDITNLDSFLDLEDWLAVVKRTFGVADTAAASVVPVASATAAGGGGGGGGGGGSGADGGEAPPAEARPAMTAAPAAGSGRLPYLALIGNKTDLSHMRTVKMSRHTDFAAANGMASFLMSAKTGDQVQSTFFRIAADLAGIPISRPDVVVHSKVVKAELVNHQKDDPTVKEPEKPKPSRCLVM